MAATTRVQVFARAPISGTAKTRLIPRIGADAAANLQTILTDRALTTALASDIGPVELWCSPDDSHPSFRAWGARGVRLLTQSGTNLGERMQCAISSALSSGDNAVLIGSDCPNLSTHDLHEAVKGLDGQTEWVFAPAEDGGYVLVAVSPGAHRSLPHLFDGIDWGSDRVMEQTRLRMRKHAQQWRELATQWDIDRPEDYDRLLRELPGLLAALA